MSWKSFAFVAALSFAVAPAFAIPSLSFVDNADGTGTFQISPDASLFPTAAGGSIAFEIEVTGVTGGAITAAAENATDFPRANPGDFNAGVATGITFTGTTLTAAFGSDLFTTGDPVDAITITVDAASTLTYEAIVAQAGANNPFSGSADITLGGPLNPGDFDGDGKVDNGDLNLLLGNWGSAADPIPGWVNNLNPPVDNGELNDLLGNWGFGVSVAVPEPTSILMLTVAGVALAGVRRNG